MAISPRLLGDDETVLLQRRTHVKVLFLPVLAALVLLAVTIAVGLVLPADQAMGRMVTAIVGAVLILVVLVPPILRWATSTSTLTNRRLITRSGVFTKRGHDIPLTRINDVGFEHGLVDRLFGCGTLVIESAGERGQVMLRDVSKVEEMHRALAELLYGGDGVEGDRR